MAKELTKQELIDFGVTGVYEDLRSPGGFIVKINNKPVKPYKDVYGWKITVTDKTRTVRVNGVKKPYRRAIPLPRVVFAWFHGSIPGNYIAYYDPAHNECVACSRVDFWKNNVNNWARRLEKKGEK